MLKENAFCHTDYRDGTLSASIDGEIDHHTVVAIREKIDALIFRHRPEKLIIDLKKVSFMDSSGLGLILGRASLCQETGARVLLVNASERTRKILSLAGVSRIENLLIEANKEKKK